MFCLIEITIKPRHLPNGYRNKILSIAFNVTKLIAFKQIRFKVIHSKYDIAK